MTELNKIQHKAPGLATNEIAFAGEVREAGEGLGLYMHVPFCATTCDFCAFYQTKPSAEGIAGYLEGMRAEAELVGEGKRVDTVFWGGGTPGLLSPVALRELGQVVREFGGGGGPTEWTVEMAPASVTEARLAALKEVGVTRISMGVQSFQPVLLDALGRQHTREQVFRAYDRVRAAGFASVNVDLMFALPGQDEAAWMADIAEAVGLAPDHVSTYCLTFEEDTKLWVKLSQGKVKLDPELEARLYERTWEALGEAGYGQYEVSNFARPGHACSHNLNTWGMREWVGLGPSAASQHGGWRGANVADLEAWRAGVAAGRRMTEDRVELTADLLLEDAVIFGLRMNRGVDLTVLRRRFPAGPWGKIEAEADALAEAGVVEREGSTLRLTQRGRLLADAVAERMMEAF